jgi:MinD-like ATPase involved in chromosome partitioning or flagellar assembly
VARGNVCVLHAELGANGCWRCYGHSMSEDPYRGAFQQTEPVPPRRRLTYAGVDGEPGQATSDPVSAAVTGVDDTSDQQPAAGAELPLLRELPQFSPLFDETSGTPRPAFHGTHSGSGPVALDFLNVKRRRVPAKKGWRALLHHVTRINLGPGKDERYEIDLRDRVRRIVRATFPIAIVNLKGGVGKTVVSETLGSTFAAVRGDRVIDIDLDVDAGNLIDRHGRESSLSLMDLAADTTVTRYLDVRAHTSINASRLEVLAAPDYTRTDRVVERDDFLNTMAILRGHYSLVLMDCGTGLNSPLMEAVLRESRAVVVVCGASIDAMKETDILLERLHHKGFQHLLESTLLVINHTEPGRPNILVDKAIEQFSRYVPPQRAIVLPFDPHIREGKEIILELLSKKSQRRYLEMAAALADLFPRAAD